MPIKSIVNYSALENGRRLDAEFYQPHLSSIVELLRKKPHTMLGKEMIIRSGTTPSDRDDSLEDGIVLLKTIDIQNRVLPIKGEYYRISHVIDERMAKTRIYENDVLINIVGATLDVIGRVSIVPSGFEPANITQAMALLRPKPNSQIIPEYLFCFLMSRYGLVQVHRIARPTGQFNLNLQELSGFVTPLLTKKFQSIIRIFVKNATEKQTRSYECYSKAEQLLLSELSLQDWKPQHTLTYVRNYGQAARVRRMDAEHFHPKYQEMFDRLSPSVRLDRLGKLTTYTKGVEVGSPAYTDSGIPFWRVSDLTKHGLDDGNANFVSDELYSSLRSAYEPQQGEILLSKDATPGLAYHLEQPLKGIVSSGILRLTITNDIPPHYLELVLNSLFVQLQIEQDSGGSVIKHWKPSEVRNTLIPRLSLTKENEIAELVQQSHAAQREAKTKLEKAKRAVEIAIEESEEKATTFLNN